MSWDIFVQDLPKNARRIEDIPSDFRPQSILPRARIEAVFKKVAPFTDFSNPRWWRVTCSFFSIEVNIGTEDPSNGFAWHVRGGEQAAGFVAEVVTRLGFRALDPCSDTGFFDPEKCKESFLKWKAYRDHVISKEGE